MAPKILQNNKYVYGHHKCSAAKPFPEVYRVQSFCTRSGAGLGAGTGLGCAQQSLRGHIHPSNSMAPKLADHTYCC